MLGTSSLTALVSLTVGRMLGLPVGILVMLSLLNLYLAELLSSPGQDKTCCGAWPQDISQHLIRDKSDELIQVFFLAHFYHNLLSQ